MTTVAPVPRAQLPHAELSRAAGVRVVAVPRPASRVRETLDALAQRPSLLPLMATAPLATWQVRVLWQQLRPVVGHELAARRPDLVLVEIDASGGWLGDLPSELPVLLSLHDVAPGFLAARAAATSGLEARWLAVEQARAWRDLRRWLPRCARLVCVSEADAALLRDGLGAAAPPIDVVANGVDLAAFPLAGQEPPEERPVLLFTGTMNYHPNVEGIGWFAERVWPRVRAELPTAELVVVGRDPSAAVRALGELDGITVTGGVPDVAPYFAAAHVVVVPLLSGGGTRLKIVEAAASGRAIVSTARGAEGLDVRDGRELVLADDPERFARETIALLRDAPCRARLATAARAFAERQDWRALGDRFERAALAAAGRDAT